MLSSALKALELALKVGTELIIVLASNGDVRGDVINDTGRVCCSIPLTILVCLDVLGWKVGDATGIFNGTLYLLEMETSLGHGVLPMDGRGSLLVINIGFGFVEFFGLVPAG